MGAVEQYLVTSWDNNYLLLALQLGKVASFVGKIFVVQYSNIMPPRKLPIVDTRSTLILMYILLLIRVYIDGRKTCTSTYYDLKDMTPGYNPPSSLPAHFVYLIPHSIQYNINVGYLLSK